MTINREWRLTERPSGMVAPQSTLQILPEAGHLAWADQPALFANMNIDWAETAHQ